MKSFDPDFTLRSHFQAQYTDVLFQPSSFDPVLPPYGSYSAEHTALYPELIDFTQPLHVQPLLATFSPMSTSSGFTHSTIITSPGSTEKFDSTTSSQPISRVFTTAESSKNKRKRRCTTEDDILDGRCKLIRLPRLAKSNTTLDKGKQPAVVPWKKSILVRIKPHMDEIVTDLRYTFVKLPNPDVHCCTAAICAKIGIPFTKGMSVSWLDSETLLRGPFDHDFLQGMADMQDFVIDVVEIGVRGDVGLLLEM